MKYGHFSKDAKEYIVTNSNTPRPWFNYLFNREYHALVSQTGGGFSYYRDPKVNRILRYDHIHTDRPGRYVFLNDKKSGEYWSANGQPFKKKLDAWECRHGLGYTSIKSEYDNIQTKITYFVPLTGTVEMWLVSVKNNGKTQRKLGVFPYVEFVSGNIQSESLIRNIFCLYNEAYFDEEMKSIIAFKHPPAESFGESYAFFSASGSIKRYDCNKENFMGRYNDIQSPEAILKGKLTNSYARGEDMIGALEKELTLKPQEESEFVVVLGAIEKKESIKGLLEKYRDIDNSRRLLEEVKSHWKIMTEEIVVNTPDENFNLMVNIWGKYQLKAITCWRGTSQYHGGEGGLGYRDTAQDIEGLLSLDLDLAKNRLDKILYYQYKSGNAVSGFSEVEGSWEKSGEAGVVGKADVCVWLPFTVVSYVKETGDTDFLKKEYAFHDGDKATVLEHIVRAVRYLYSQRGEHGLPYIKRADWNDAYDSIGLKGKGESVWLAMALCRACRQIESLAKFINDEKIASEMKEKYDNLVEIINKEGWDGEWYLAAFNDDGMKIGSLKSEEGKVCLNSQTWALLGEVVKDEIRKKKILDKIDNYLDTPYGPALTLPSYTRYNSGIGRVTAFAPGTKENAAVFSHACAFKIVADCFIGRGDKAYETFSKLCPMSEAKNDHNKYKVEPYVWAEYVIGPGSKEHFGEGAFTWNTGTAPWMFQAATEWILGARRHFDGLLIDPCIPKKWKSCSIRRPFRGDVYMIKIENQGGVETGVKEIYVDGNKIHGKIIKPVGDGKEHAVKVIMGK